MAKYPGEHRDPDEPVGRGLTLRLGRHEDPRWVTRWLLPIAVIALAASIAAVALAVSRRLDPPGQASPSGLPATADCSQRREVDVVAAPHIAEAVAEAVAEAEQRACVTLTVTTEEPGITAAGDPPAIWIPDSSIWPHAVNATRPGTVEIGDSLASSPLVLAVPAGQEITGTTWAEILQTDGVVLPDPATSGATLLAVAAGYADQNTTPETRRGLVTLMANPAGSDGDLVDGPASGPFPVEEAALRDQPGDLAEVIPDPTLRFDYPVVTRADADSTEEAAAQALTQALLGPALRNTVTAGGLRNSVREANPPGLPEGAPVYLPEPSADLAADVVADADRAGRPASVLFAVDVSGSMYRTLDGPHRVGIANDAVAEAMSTMPPSTRAGLWIFAENRGGPGQDYDELAPMAALDDAQRAGINAGLQDTAGVVGGETGLYATIEAGHRQLVADTDPDRIAAMVVFTDGVDERTQGPALADLLTALEGADPDHPVPVIFAAITKNPDLTNLTEIADATGGQVIRLTDPAQARALYADLLLGPEE